MNKAVSRQTVALASRSVPVVKRETMKLHSMLLLVPLVSAITLTGCGRLREMDNNVPPGRVVAISLFKCNCESVVRETVQDSFLDVFFRTTNAQPVKGDNGDIAIVGIITMAEGQTGRSTAGASGQAASRAYISGISIQAFKNGELIATHSVGQNLNRGVLISPITFAKTAASHFSTMLVRQNELGRR